MAILGSVAGLGLTAGPVAASSTLEGADARSAASTSGACTTGKGVTVIIDFQELGGGSSVHCAPNAPATGFEALKQAGISYDTAASSPGFLCRIAGKPANDPCRVPSPTTAYWSYWLAPRGGQWCYANFGAGSRQPPAGTVEGWSFVQNKSASATPPPRIAPPVPTPGVAAPQLPAKDCTAPTEGVPPTTSPPSTRPTPAPTKPSRPSNPSGPSGPSNPSRTKPRPGDGGSGSTNGSGPKTAPGGRSSTSSKVGGDDTTTTAPTNKTTSTTLATDADTSDNDADGGDDDGDDDGGGDDGGDATSPDGVKGSGSRGITDPDEIAALEGDVDLGDDGRSKGSPVPLVAAGVVGVGLVAGGVWQRRRSRASADPS